MTERDIWEALKAGKQVTDGEQVLAQTEEGNLYRADDENIGVERIPFRDDNFDDWEIVDNNVQYYCRWYTEAKGSIYIGTCFHPLENTPVDGWSKLNEAFTRNEILGVE